LSIRERQRERCAINHNVESSGQCCWRPARIWFKIRKRIWSAKCPAKGTGSLYSCSGRRNE
jgi:hypothetical protein